MVAGALGAAARYALDGYISRRVGSSFPWGTLIINVSGSMVLGLLYTLLTNRIANDSALRLAMTVGFLGSYTTFPTLTLDRPGSFRRDRMRLRP
jgi:fluoride exporter